MLTVDRRELIALPGLSYEEIKDLAKGSGPGFDTMTVRCIASDYPVSSSSLQLFRCKQQCPAVVCQLHADHFAHIDWASVNVVQEQQGIRPAGACSSPSVYCLASTHARRRNAYECIIATFINCIPITSESLSQV